MSKRKVADDEALAAAMQEVEDAVDVLDDLEALDASCDWPHVTMTPDEERAVAQVIEQFRPFIEQQAAEVGRGQPQLVPDLEQEARILLWRWGADKIASFPATYVRSAIVWKMRNVRNADMLRAVTEPTPEDQPKVA
jgi:hypothetical protein